MIETIFILLVYSQKHSADWTLSAYTEEHWKGRISPRDF
jgi:hypothetical protein